MRQRWRGTGPAIRKQEHLAALPPGLCQSREANETIVDNGGSRSMVELDLTQSVSMANRTSL